MLMILLELKRITASRAKKKFLENRYTRGGRAEDSRSNTKVARFRPIRSTNGAEMKLNRKEATVPATIRRPRAVSVRPISFRYRLM